MKITDLLSAQSVKVGATAASQADAIDQLVALQVAAGNVSDADGYKAGVLAREAEFSTAVGDGIAIPHAKVAAVAKAGLAAMTIPGGVDWNAPDDAPCDLVFAIAAPEGENDVHLEMLAKLSALLMHEDFAAKLRAAVPNRPRVQIVIGDGLSSAAIMANAMDCAAAIRDGLKLRGIETDDPVFVRYCRVGAGDAVGDITGCELVCVLVGERPGLVTDKSMSAYLTYQPRTGVLESSRTVVSNIHAQGTPAVEAGAHIAGLIETILRRKVSGVQLHLEEGA